MIRVSVLKQIAANRVNRIVQNEEDLIDFIKVWWSEKYKLPDNHSLFLAKTLEEHVLDYHTYKAMNDRNNEDPVIPIETEEEKAKLKELMGEDWHEEYDYLIPPTTTELKGNKTEKTFKTEHAVLGSDEPIVEFDDDYTTIGSE